MEALNNCSSLKINFPDCYYHQWEITTGFKKCSKAWFSCCKGSLEGILVWIEKANCFGLSREALWSQTIFPLQENLNLDWNCKLSVTHKVILWPQSVASWVCLWLPGFKVWAFDNAYALSIWLLPSRRFLEVPRMHTILSFPGKAIFGICSTWVNGVLNLLTSKMKWN